MRLALLSVILAWALAAQETKPEDKCSLEGKVLHVASGEPVKKADVMLRRADRNPGTEGAAPTTYSTSTDAGGKFAMKDIEPGKYRLSVSRAGFVTAEYGSRGSMRSGTTLSLEAGQRLQEVNFRLTPHGVITGRVLDEDGDPVAFVQVATMRYRYNQGRKQLMGFGATSTNDLGEYRIFGIAPGKYYLSATYRPRSMFETTMDRSSTPQPDEEYVPTYYPGTTDPASATAVEVLPGGQIRGMDFTLSKTHTVRVRGQVKNLAAERQQNVRVTLTPRDRMGFFDMSQTTVRDRQGHFELRGVAAGAYYLAAVLFDGDRSLSARQAVDVGSANVENIVLTLAPGVELAGRVRVDGQSPAGLSSIRLMLQPYDPGVLYGGVSMGRVKVDGSFTLTDVGTERYRLYAQNLPEGYYVKSVRLGEDEALEAPIDLSRGGGPLDVVLGANAGEVNGAVMNAKQEPTPGATVVLIPQSAKRREGGQFYKMVTTDQYGQFTIKGVEPGEYKAFAWEDVEMGAYMDPEFVKPVENRGQAVSVHEGGREKIQLDLIPAEAGSQSEPGRSAQQ